MAVISFINPKGGSGKTTTAFALAEQFARAGMKICLLDTDPNGFGATWLSARDDEGLSAPIFDIYHEVEGPKVVATLNDLRAAYDLVLVDTEGTANQTSTRVLSRTNLAIIPLNPSYMDAEQAGRAVALITEVEQMLDRDIDYRMLFSRAPAAIKTNSLKTLLEQLSASGLKVMSAQMIERRGMRDIFQFNRTLDELAEAAVADLQHAEAAGDRTEIRRLNGLLDGYRKAMENARQVAAEVIEVLNEIASRSGTEEGRDDAPVRARKGG